VRAMVGDGAVKNAAPFGRHSMSPFRNKARAIPDGAGPDESGTDEIFDNTFADQYAWRVPSVLLPMKYEVPADDES